MSRKIRVLIVDDEELARVRIRDLLAGVSDVAIAGECQDGAAAIRAIEADSPDLMFLEVLVSAADPLSTRRTSTYGVGRAFHCDGV